MTENERKPKEPTEDIDYTESMEPTETRPRLTSEDRQEASLSKERPY